jgi:hypothetical protein
METLTRRVVSNGLAATVIEKIEQAVRTLTHEATLA